MEAFAFNCHHRLHPRWSLTIWELESDSWPLALASDVERLFRLVGHVHLLCDLPTCDLSGGFLVSLWLKKFLRRRISWSFARTSEASHGPSAEMHPAPKPSPYDASEKQHSARKMAR